MNLATDDFRHERKLLPVGCAHPVVLDLIRRHPAGFREAYAPRWVNNLYLDSPRLEDYHDHVTGLAERCKSRIRWYGDLRGAIATPVFERKCKKGTLNRKLTSAVPPLTLGTGLNESGLRAVMGEVGLGNSLSRCLEGRQPSLINRYHRHYYLSGDGRVRLTVDSHLSFYTPERVDAMLASSAPPDYEVVIELKYAPNDSDSAAEIANGFPCRIARCSKYVLGIEATLRA